ncbi:flagellar basal-body rod protein FlgF [Selenomonas sp. TAMA-11512]|uniref:flagellar hook-basal body protein n=1 Tax=Selenomonas sp. TAMA-11512 TaxID=3095337 RepID=UPI00308E135E|nr:flagellar basal-body rod protein FlgF [Selenomonas sp. TAMA-11512]
MWRGLYIAGSGMITETNRTDVIANNIANAASSGYKRDEAVHREFAPMLLRRINDTQDEKITSVKQFRLEQGAPAVGILGLGSYTDEIVTDHAQGAFLSTGNTYDVAIAGEGFFAVETPQGVRYTRDGSFYRQTDGTLVTSKGYLVLNERNRPINIPEARQSVAIGGAGEIMVDGALIDTLAFVQFDSPRAAVKQGDNLYVPREGAQPQAATGSIQQGLLERSNVNIASEMVNLIHNYRIYEAGSKAVTTQDSMADKAVNDVGRIS